MLQRRNPNFAKVRSKSNYLFLAIIFLLVNRASAQGITDYDEWGISLGARHLVGNSNELISDIQGTNNYSIGAFYNYVPSDYWTIPVYVYFTRDIIRLSEGNADFKANYLDVEFDYRRYIVFWSGGRLFLEGGLQNRFLLSNNEYISINGNSFSFNQYIPLAKFGFGMEIDAGHFAVFVLSLEYQSSFKSMFDERDMPNDQYIGFKLSVPFTL